MIRRQSSRESKKRTLIRLTASADSIRMPHLPGLSGEHETVSDATIKSRVIQERTEPRLVSDHMSGQENRIRREALRAFVNIQERAEPMPGAVLR